MNDLSSAIAKLGRADLHIKEADLIHQKFIKSDFYAVRKNINSDRRFSIEVAFLKEWPPEFALSIGDAAHNLRSALDHIVFALATKPLTPKEEGDLAFPLVSDSASSKTPAPDRFREFARRKLSKVRQPAIDLIETYQPYNGGKQPVNTFLAQLQSIDNWDKHRALPITSGLTKSAMFFPSIAVGIKRSRMLAGRLEVGAILCDIELQEGFKSDEVNMQGDVTISPIFGEGMPIDIRGISIVRFLEQVYKIIGGEIISAFEKV